MNVTLYRDKSISDGVFGVLTCSEGTSNRNWETIEDDWKNNQPNESCIPAGVYTLVRTIYHKHNIEAFEVTGVPGRNRILVHIANTEENVQGCIGLGLRRGPVLVAEDEDTHEKHVTKWGVLSSKIAIDQFMTFMTHVDRCPFTVTWAPGLP